jgi:chitodextrinase
MGKILFILIIFTIGFGKTVCAQTQDTIPPSAPANLSLTAVPSSRVTLSWSASTDNVGIAGYYIYRNGILITAINSTSFTDSGLSPGGYTYVVAAYDAAGNISRQSSPATILLLLDSTPPSTPADLRVTANPTSTASALAQVALSWSASTDNVGVAGYYLYRDGSSVTSTAITSASYTDRVPAGTYAYTVKAYDASGNVSGQSSPASITIISDTTPPLAPTNLAAIATSSSKIYLSWTAPYDNIGIKGYYVHRAGAQIADVSSNSYVDSGLSPGGYTYSVAAYDAAGNVSNQSIPITFILVLDMNPPFAPTNLTATAISPSEIRLSWNASWDNLATAGYYVHRDNTQIATTASTSYINSGVSSGTYTYAIAAYDSSENISNQSQPITLVFPPATSAAATQPTSSPVAAITTPAITVTPPSQPSLRSSNIFTVSLYFGSRNEQIKILQSFLGEKGYFDPANATGFFGKLTEQAVKKFQCDNNIVCSGGPASTGWGVVGVKTRKTLNALYGSASVAPAVTPSATPASQQLNAQLQLLQTQLLNLQLQLQSLQKTNP